MIIAGAGKVGATVAEQLTAEGHDVTIVDLSEETTTKLSNQLDVMCIKGNCSSRETLLEAGAVDTDVLIATTESDELNLLCCYCGHRLGIPHTVARVRDISYVDEVESLKRDLNITMIVNPEHATAVEISRMLRFPNAANVDTFARGQVELVAFHVQEGDFICNHAIMDVSRRIQNVPFLFCAVERGSEVFIPNGRSVLKQGDKVYIAGTPNGIHEFFHMLGRQAHKIRRAFIIGGGRICFYLLAELERLGMSCKVVEKDAARCRTLSEAFPRATIINGDGTDPELLSEERISAADAFIALTNRDEDNLIISLYAHQEKVPKVVAKSSHQNYTSIARSAGVESVVSPKLTTAAQILQLIRGIQNSKGNTMTALYRIASNQAEAMQFRVTSDARFLGTPLKDLRSRLREGILIAVIVRDNEVIIPQGSTTLEAGDEVIVVAKDSGIIDLDDIYQS